MPSINTWLYTEIDDGSGDTIKLGSRVKPQRSYTLGSSTNEPQVLRNTYHVDAYVDATTEATKIFDMDDVEGPVTTDTTEVVEVWVRSRGMNAAISWVLGTPGNNADNASNSSLQLLDGVWQPLMSGDTTDYQNTGAERCATNLRRRIGKIYAMAYDDEATADGYCLIDIVVVLDVIPA